MRPDDRAATDEQPDYGPRGYLPPQAAKRARKIILREPMGLQWAVAAVVAGALVLLAGVLLLVSQTGAPGAPFEPVGTLTAIDARGAGDVSLQDGRDVLVLRAAGDVRVFTAPAADATWCAARKRLVVDGESVWQPDGRLVAGTGDSLSRLPARVHDGVLYVDAEADGTRLAPTPRREPLTCPEL
jgi:hypothetical protein